MKSVLYLILDHHSAKPLSKACQDTWLQHIDKKSSVVFVGDPLMPDTINNFEVYKPLKDEAKEDHVRITEKIAKAYEYVIQKDWDFLLRIDVDAYCNVNNLHKLVEPLDPDEDFYSGQGIHFLEDRHPCFLSNVGDDLPPKKYKYYYAQGGCYLLSRSALKKSIEHMYYPAPIESRAEDIMVGDAMSKAGIKLSDRPDLFCCGYIGKGWHNMPIRHATEEEHIKKITEEGYISTHKITAEQIYKINNCLS